VPFCDIIVLLRAMITSRDILNLGCYKSDVNKWVMWLVVFLGFMDCMVLSLSCDLRIITWVWCYAYVRVNVISWVRLLNVLFDNLMSLCDGTLFPMHDAMVSTSLAICDSHVLNVGSVLPCLKSFGGIKCYVRFSVPRNLVVTLSSVWSSGKGSSSPVWSSGRGLVQVLYLLACVKQWGGERWFTLFWLVASKVPDVRCIDFFTHNSLRNKGDSLIVIVRHIEPSVQEN